MKVGKTTYKIDGTEVSEKQYLKIMKQRGKLDGVPHCNRAWDKEMTCEALAVQPHHVKFERQIDAEQGINVRYDRNGCPVFENRKQRNDYIRKKGYFDRNAGYGDVQPVNR